ncbi:ABC-2 family transporter protein [Quadrisphaera granulorum]|uniref:ABC-2 family transporter n=1 Tax=Quadrisphaera granulorum TaxID=317664 RepID=A0A315ZZC8_9ACTN|nr:ABC transporter permease [Quadrisphaera granulorum]PWJ50220.1 ABC-2 family transporter [Quadrisphaera granulorum]SZE97986.1 ABC-2 family transporter protein [Quadrisphaera granulorum]
MTTEAPTPISRTTTTARGRRTVTPLQRTLRLARFETSMLAKQRTTLVTLLSGPLLVLGLAAISPSSSPQALAALAGMGVVVVMSLTTHFAAVMLTVNRREAQVLKRLRTSELSGSELVTGMYLPLAVVGVLESLAVVAVLAARGGALPDAVGWLPWLAGVLIGSAGLVAAGVAVAGLSGNAEKANWAAVPLLVVISGAANMLTVGVLPEAVRQVLLLVPFASLTDLVARTSGASVSLVELPDVVAGVPPELVDLVLLLLWTVVFAAVAKKLWRWEPRG